MISFDIVWFWFFNPCQPLSFARRETGVCHAPPAYYREEEYRVSASQRRPLPLYKSHEFVPAHSPRSMFRHRNKHCAAVRHQPVITKSLERWSQDSKHEIDALD